MYLPRLHHVFKCASIYSVVCTLQVSVPQVNTLPSMHTSSVQAGKPQVFSSCDGMPDWCSHYRYLTPLYSFLQFCRLLCGNRLQCAAIVWRKTEQNYFGLSSLPWCFLLLLLMSNDCFCNTWMKMMFNSRTSIVKVLCRSGRSGSFARYISLHRKCIYRVTQKKCPLALMS